MSLDESNIHHYFEQVKKRLITLIQASEYLNISYRHAKRLWNGYKKAGVLGIISKKRGQPSNRKIPNERRAEIAGIISVNYHDFKPKFAAEKLYERHGITISKETTRQIMTEYEIWFPSKKRYNPHQTRPRRRCRGELILTDASDHLWFEERGPQCHLYITIDDSSSEIISGHFEEEETTHGYFTLFTQHIEKNGIPLSVYCDKRGTFKVNQRDKNGITQFGRAMKKLGVTVIFAHSPQAKGRVERAFGTLQDRLIKEMRLRNISTIEEGNKFLPEFLKMHNLEFAKKPSSPIDAHKPLKGIRPLKYILCYKEQRVVTKNLEVNYENEIYQIQAAKLKHDLRKVVIDILTPLDGEMRFEYEGEGIEFKKFNEIPYQPLHSLSEDFQTKGHHKGKKRAYKKQPQSKKKLAKVIDIRGYFEREETLTKNEKQAAGIRLEMRRNESRKDNLEIRSEDAFKGGSR